MVCIFAEQESRTLRINDIHELVHQLPESNFEMLDVLVAHLCKWVPHLLLHALICWYCFYLWSGRHPREMSIWRWRAWCAGMSFPSLATWPNRLLRLLIIRSTSGGSPVCSAISVLWIQSYHQIPTICLWHFILKDFKWFLVSVANRVRCSLQYNYSNADITCHHIHASE